jgi:hypothetical protein
LPAPRIGKIKRAADLAGAAVRDIEKSSRIAATPPAALGEVQYDAARSALDLIRSLGTMPSKLYDHGAQGANQIQGDVISN